MTETLSVQTPRTGVAVVQLNRPKQLNAINDVMVGELMQALAALATDATVNAVVFTGAGRGFCSGLDMRNFGPGMRRPTRRLTGCVSRRRWPPSRRRFVTCRSR
jgi:enoyl-CoA hydratase